MKKDINVALPWEERQEKDLRDAAIHSEGLRGSPWFRPRKSATKRFDFWTADFEAENWDGSDGITGVSRRRQTTWFDGRAVHETPEHPHSEDAFLKELITGPYVNQCIYFHHLDYDQAFLMEGIEHLGLSPIPIKTHVLVSLDVPLDPSDPEAKVIRFRDSMCLTQTSLKTLTKEFDVAHKKLDVEDGDFFNRAYRHNDVVGLHEALTAYFGILGWDIGLTLASTSMRHFRRNYLSRPIFRNRKHHSACRKCLFGGRTETTRFNFEPDKDFFSYDVNSLYPSIMLNLDVPTGPFRQTCEDIEGVGMTFADVREDENYPCLPVRGTKLFFTNGIKRGWFVNEELRAARERGAKMKLGTSLVSDTTEKIFSRFVTELYAMRQKAKAEGKSGLSLTIKLLQNCFSTDTEVLTEAGIRNIKDIRVGEKVYSFNTGTGMTELKKVTRTFAYPYKGRMIHFGKKVYDFLVTPNHRFWVKKRNSPSAFTFMEAREIYDHQLPNILPIPGKEGHVVSLEKYAAPRTVHDGKWFPFSIDRNGRRHVPKHKYYGAPYQFALTDLLELGGWYASEGSLTKGGVQISQSPSANPENVSRIKGLMDRMGVRSHQHGMNIGFEHFLLRSWLVENFGRYADGVFLPEWVFAYSSGVLSFLYRSLMAGDETKPAKRQTLKYTTMSSRLASDFQRLCVHLGLRTRRALEDGNPEKHRPPIWRVFIYRERVSCMSRHRGSIRDGKNNSDHVYCIEVEDNHTVLAGRNGTLNVVGQSLFGKYGQRSEGFNYFFSPDKLPPEGAIPLNLKNSFYKMAKETDAEHIIPFIAAQVTAGGRVRMLKEIDKLSDPQSLYMMDTDSMVLDGQYLASSTKIGDFKYEGRITKFFVFGPKLYFYETSDGVMTAKVKGVHATTSEKKVTEGAHFVAGQTVTNRDGLLGFLSAAKKSSNGKFAFRKTVTRTYAGEFDKRKVMPDGTTVPFQWDSTIPPIGFPNPSFVPVLEAIRKNFKRAFPEIMEKIKVTEEAHA